MSENEKASKAPATKIVVTMDDGKQVEFTGKKKLIKTATIEEDGSVVVRLDFVNGEYRVFRLPDNMLSRFAAHGAEQKLGDEIAGIEDVEDCVATMDELLVRLENGEWNVKRESSGAAGASVLVKALMELSGKSKPEITAFLAAKTHAEKLALRSNAKLKPIVDRLEAEKAARSKKKGNTIDSDALLDGLGAQEEVEAA